MHGLEYLQPILLASVTAWQRSLDRLEYFLAVYHLSTSFHYLTSYDM